MDPKIQVKAETASTGYDLAGQVVGGVSPCVSCVFKYYGSAKCWAFPSGIPEDVQTGRVVHDRKLPEYGQTNDLTWSTREGKKWPIDHE
jgi:hypothetical protein